MTQTFTEQLTESNAAIAHLADMTDADWELLKYHAPEELLQRLRRVLHQPADAQGLVRELRSIIRRLYRLSDVLLSAEEGETMEKANTFLGEKS